MKELLEKFAASGISALFGALGALLVYLLLGFLC